MWTKSPVKIFNRSKIRQVPCQYGTYPDTLESINFLLRIWKFARPYVAYSNRICPHMRIWIQSGTQDSSVNIVNRARAKDNLCSNLAANSLLCTLLRPFFASFAFISIGTETKEKLFCYVIGSKNIRIWLSTRHCSWTHTHLNTIFYCPFTVTHHCLLTDTHTWTLTYYCPLTVTHHCSWTDTHLNEGSDQHSPGLRKANRSMDHKSSSATGWVVPEAHAVHPYKLVYLQGW